MRYIYRSSLIKNNYIHKTTGKQKFNELLIATTFNNIIRVQKYSNFHTGDCKLKQIYWFSKKRRK